MAVKIVEKISEVQISEQKYDKHSNRRAFLFQGKIWRWDETKSYSYYSDPNGEMFWWGLDICSQLKLLGFQLSRELQHKCAVKQAEKDEYRRQQKADLEAKRSLARETGKPVVVCAAYYQTTASYGTNYEIAMPNGNFVDVTNGTSTASHSDKGGTTNDDAAIQAAIREYNRQLYPSVPRTRSNDDAETEAAMSKFINQFG